MRDLSKKDRELIDGYIYGNLNAIRELFPNEELGEVRLMIEKIKYDYQKADNIEDKKIFKKVLRRYFNKIENDLFKI